jgi:hypothetical protein
MTTAWVFPKALGAIDIGHSDLSLLRLSCLTVATFGAVVSSILSGEHGSLICGQVLCNIIYRLTYHPLARYPGPLLAKLTEGYAAYHGWIGDTHLDAQICHEKYGKLMPARDNVDNCSSSQALNVSFPGTFVRYGPNRLLVNSVGGLRGKSLNMPSDQPDCID